MTAPANGRTQDTVTVAQRHGYGGEQGAAGAAAAAALPTPGAATRRANLGGKLRPWLVGAALGLLVGGAAVGYVAYQTMPIAATEVQRVFADVNGDGSPDLIVSAWVVFAPKAGGQ